MSVNSQILNIINDIEKLNEQTTTLDNNVDTINGNIQTLEDNKQNNITVLDTIQISKLKTQYITMSLTGQDLQSTLTILEGDITALEGRLDTEEPKITALETLTATHTSQISQISSNDTDILELQGRLDIEEPKITALQTLTTSHTSALNTKQKNIVSTDDLTCNSITINNLEVNGGVRIDSSTYFDTIVIRRFNEAISPQINLNELQVWVNGSNILVENSAVLTSYFFNWSDKDTEIPPLLYQDIFRSVSLIYNNVIEPDFGTHSLTSSTTNALIIKNIPLTLVNDIQALILYNRKSTNNIRTLGLIIELYNSTIDPNIDEVLATTNEITIASETYRFDFPSISTYTDFVDGISVTNIVNNIVALTEVATIISFNTEINGDVLVVGDLTANNFIVGSTNLITEITYLQGRLNTEEPKISSLESVTSSLATQISEIELTPGPQGDAGEIGATGTKGDAGEIGATGANGDAGSIGETGAKGDAGPIGETGAKGDAGSIGETGAKGDAGPIGETGAKGDAGSIGETGAKGDACSCSSCNIA